MCSKQSIRRVRGESPNPSPPTPLPRVRGRGEKKASSRSPRVVVRPLEDLSHVLPTDRLLPLPPQRLHLCRGVLSMAESVQGRQRGRPPPGCGGAVGFISAQSPDAAIAMPPRVL